MMLLFLFIILLFLWLGGGRESGASQHENVIPKAPQYELSFNVLVRH